MGSERHAGLHNRNACWRGRVLILVGLSWLTGSAGAAFAQSADSALEPARGSCAIRFVGSSTLHDFEGEVAAKPFEIASHVDPTGGRSWWSSSVAVAVADMTTGIDRRDANMREMFDAEHFPRIVAEFPRVESGALDAIRGGRDASLEFDLTIRDQKRRVAAKVTSFSQQGHNASFDAEFEVSLKSFGLEPPVVLGLLRVDDVVSVHAHVSLEGPSGKGGGTSGGTTPLDAPARTPASPG